MKNILIKNTYKNKNKKNDKNKINFINFILFTNIDFN